RLENGFTAMLREVNKFMDRTIKWLEGTQRSDYPRPAPMVTPATPKAEPQKKTAIQVINDMVKARLTQPEVDVMDDHGVRGSGTIPSQEYKLLQSRGLKVLSVGIN